MHSKRFRRFAAIAASAFFVAVAFVDHAAAANSHQVLYNFTGGIDGGNAATDVTFDSSGAAYGTTVVGGAYGCGTLFKATPARGQWNVATLWSFSCGSDGKNPHGGVTLDAAGNIYGTTVAGGSGGFCTGDGCGVVFEFTHNGVMQTLYNFTGQNDGFGAGGRVILDKSGNLYGTTPDGGKHGVGVVYQLSFHNNAWQETVIHAFTGRNDGAVGSLGPLLMDGAGNLYGIAELGGIHQAGTAFKISPSGGSWTFKTIYAFRGSPDAGFPYGGLIADPAGDLFGTTYYGGTNGLGSVYELRPVGTQYQERVLYSFQGGSDGSSPTTTLIFAGSPVAHLYGTTSAGGNTCDCGTIFKVGVHTRTESIIYRFGSSQSDGAYPYYSLSFDMNGDLVTSTVAGGTFGQGVLFGIRP